MFRERSFDSVTERRLFTLQLKSPGDLREDLDLPPGHFTCLLAWDARGVSVDVISMLAERLLIAGASYFVCWGPDCERVHDIIDEIAADPGAKIDVPDGSCIMTTWHSSEPLSEALGFFLVAAFPDPHYVDTTHAAVAVSIGSESWSAELGDALDRPRQFVSHWSQREDA